MMKNFLKSLSILSFGLFAILGPVNVAFAGDGSDTDGIGKFVDVTGTAGGAVTSCADAMRQLMAKTTDEQALDVLVDGLKKAGMDRGWAKQIGGLKKYAGIAGSLLKMLNLADSVRQLESVWDVRCAFSKKFADLMTEHTANVVGDLVTKWLIGKGTIAVAAGTIAAPGVGTIIAEGGVWLGSWLVGQGVTWTLKKIAGADTIRGALIEIGGIIWDYFHHPVTEDPDPFDTAPGNGGNSGQSGGDNKKGYQGLKTLRLVH